MTKYRKFFNRPYMSKTACVQFVSLCLLQCYTEFLWRTVSATALRNLPANECMWRMREISRINWYRFRRRAYKTRPLFLAMHGAQTLTSSRHNDHASFLLCLLVASDSKLYSHHACVALHNAQTFGLVDLHAELAAHGDAHARRCDRRDNGPFKGTDDKLLYKLAYVDTYES